MHYQPSMSDFKSTVSNLLWRLVSGPALLFAIAQLLSPIYQGYWFTFVSFAALSAFADLGLTTVVLQFSANRFSKLQFNSSGYLHGVADDICKISSLFTFFVKWIACVSLIAFPIILAIGICFLGQKEEQIDWMIPWVLYSAASVLFLVGNVVLSFFEGCDSVATIQKFKLYLSMGNVGVSLGALWAGLNLYALALGVFASCLITGALVYKKFKPVIVQMVNSAVPLGSTEKTAIRKLLGRYAVSFVSGYFVFQAFTPIAFYYYGPIEAGQVGLTLSIWLAILSLSNVWMVVVTPRINMLAATQDFSALGHTFRINLKRSVLTFLLGASVFVVLLALITGHFEIAQRVLSIGAQIQLGVVFLCQVVIAGMATYVRSFLKEPFALMSLVSAVLINVVTIFVAANWSVNCMFVGMLLGCCFSLPLTYYYFQQARVRI